MPQRLHVSSAARSFLCPSPYRRTGRCRLDFADEEEEDRPAVLQTLLQVALRPAVAAGAVDVDVAAVAAAAVDVAVTARLAPALVVVAAAAAAVAAPAAAATVPWNMTQHNQIAHLALVVAVVVVAAAAADGAVVAVARTKK